MPECRENLADVPIRGAYRHYLCHGPARLREDDALAGLHALNHIPALVA